MKLSLLNIITAFLLGITVGEGAWWYAIPFAVVTLFGWLLSNPKYWVTLPRADYEEEVEE